MKKKIIIFGATGTVGLYTALELKEKYEVIAVGRRKSDNGFFTKYNIPYYSVDVTIENEFKKIVENDIFAVVHLAGIMPATMEGYHPEQYIDSIIKGTLNVLNFCVNRKVDRIIFGQSRADSNYLMDKGPIPSDIIKKFPLTGDHSVYSICKNAAVDLIEHYYNQFGLKRYVLRFTTVYAYHPNPYFHVNGIKKKMAYRYMIDEAVKGNPLEIWGDPRRSKEIVYVKDVVQLINCCLESQVDGGIYNLGRGVGVSLEEQILGIVDVFCNSSKKSKVTYRPDKPNARDYVNDISKTKKELGYNPVYDYKKLLEDYKYYYDNEPFELIWGRKEDYE